MGDSKFQHVHAPSLTNLAVCVPVQDSLRSLGIFPLVDIAGATLHQVVHFRPSVHFRPRVGGRLACVALLRRGPSIPRRAYRGNLLIRNSTPPSDYNMALGMCHCRVLGFVFSL